MFGGSPLSLFAGFRSSHRPCRIARAEEVWQQVEEEEEDL